MARHQAQYAARLQGVDGLGKKEVMQGQLLAVIVELEIGERHIADHGVDAVFGQLAVAKVLDADVVLRIERPGDAAGDAVQLDADELRSRPCLAHEIADAATRLQDGGVGRDSQPANGVMDGGNNGRRGVESVKGSAGALSYSAG